MKNLKLVDIGKLETQEFEKTRRLKAQVSEKRNEYGGGKQFTKKYRKVRGVYVIS